MIIYDMFMKKKLTIVFFVFVILLCISNIVIYFVNFTASKENKSNISKKDVETNLQITPPSITDIFLDSNNNSILSKPRDVVITGL